MLYLELCDHIRILGSEYIKVVGFFGFCFWFFFFLAVIGKQFLEIDKEQELEMMNVFLN